MGIAVSTLFRYRENSLLLLLWTSIPVLMLSGVSYPREGIPDWLFNLGQLFPSSHGVNGFIRIQTMGASLPEVLARNQDGSSSSRSFTAGWPASAFTR